MPSNDLTQNAQTYLQKLCVEIPSRQVGSKGNQEATDFFAAAAASYGFEIKKIHFDCIDWVEEGVSLTLGNDSFEAFASPYSLGCRVTAPLITASTVDELEVLDPFDEILLLHGEIAREQLTPKNFPFYDAVEHKRIIRLLESREPAAIITATSQDLAMVGSQYPFPLIADGDFDIPSVYTTDKIGKQLALHVGEEISLESRARRIPSKGCNVIARKGAENVNDRVVIFAHIDAQIGTPGALDNAAGVTTLLLLAELLADYSGNLGIEIVAINGEDYYANSGEQQYLALNTGLFNEIVLGINLDGVGYHKGCLAYSFYDCPPDVVNIVRRIFSADKGFVEGEQWYQGDHMLFVMNQRPALAMTSELAAELVTQINHTSKDRPELVDTQKLAHLATALRELLGHL